ncbi:Rpn family recombination-promoting nuclease/putative transposase [Salibacterium aidingense]|uniref:Rpn family recombination-promoting nuclease/putative transposase n=1 Tax=Salibacterium aidingense TaxID=384933 RepID=UPI000409556D|nr:Rpn family recombination-promoting nuclease/putative transposase [Salibacterium aidingense]
MTVDHDRLFKEVLTTYFEEFIQLFFPEVHEAVDFSNLQFLAEEVFSDVTQGEKYRVDILAKTSLKDEETLIIIHTEPQSYPQPDFNERMFLYYGRLYEKYRCNILPIALFTYDQYRKEPDHFSIAFPFHDVLHFQFLIIQLKQQNWRNFIRSDNPLAAALLSKMGYNEKEKVQVKKEFLRMMAHMKIDPARSNLLTGFFFETYPTLTSSEEKKLREEVKRMDGREGEKVREFIVSYEKKGMEKAKTEIAEEMLKKGIDIETISEVTGLSTEEVLQLNPLS